MGFLVTSKKHKKIEKREKQLRGELAVFVIAIFRIAIQWKMKKVGNLRAMSAIYELLDRNKEAIFRYRYEDPEHTIIEDQKDPDIKEILKDD